MLACCCGQVKASTQTNQQEDFVIEYITRFVALQMNSERQVDILRYAQLAMLIKTICSLKPQADSTDLFRTTSIRLSAPCVRLVEETIDSSTKYNHPRPAKCKLKSSDE